MSTLTLLAAVEQALTGYLRRPTRRRNVSAPREHGKGVRCTTPRFRIAASGRKTLDQPAGGMTPPDPSAGRSRILAESTPGGSTDRPGRGLILCPSPWLTAGGR